MLWPLAVHAHTHTLFSFDNGVNAWFWYISMLSFCLFIYIRYTTHTHTHKLLLCATHNCWHVYINQQTGTNPFDFCNTRQSITASPARSCDWLKKFTRRNVSISVVRHFNRTQLCYTHTSCWEKERDATLRDPAAAAVEFHFCFSKCSAIQRNIDECFDLTTPISKKSELFLWIRPETENILSSKIK